MPVDADRVGTRVGGSGHGGEVNGAVRCWAVSWLAGHSTAAASRLDVLGQE